MIMSEKKQKAFRDLDVRLVSGGDASATLHEGDALSFSGEEATLTGDIHIAYGNGERVRIAEHSIATVSLRTRVVEMPEPPPVRP